MEKVDIGAPSLTGTDATAAVTVALGDARFPLLARVTNHMPRDAVFPEVRGLSLRHVAAAQGTSREVVFASLAQLQRLASSIGQVADLNGYALAVSIEPVIPDATPVVSRGSARKPPATDKGA